MEEHGRTRHLADSTARVPCRAHRDLLWHLQAPGLVNMDSVGVVWCVVVPAARGRPTRANN
eukprot:2046990-Alexandrium_andersonii.AAC.1